MPAIARDEFLHLLREELPKLLREHPEVRHEVFGIFLEVFPGRQEFSAVLQEIRTLREDMDRRFQALREDMDRRFQATYQEISGLRSEIGGLREDMDRGFKATDQEIGKLREDMDRGFKATDQEIGGLRSEIDKLKTEVDRLELHMASLGLRVGRGLEHVIRGIVEEFSGQTFTTAERLVLSDTDGVVFGVKGAQVEFDLYATDGTAYLVEVKSHLDPDDVLLFWRKFGFARHQLGREVTPMIIALSAEEKAERLMRELGIQYIVRTRA